MTYTGIYLFDRDTICNHAFTQQYMNCLYHLTTQWNTTIAIDILQSHMCRFDNCVRISTQSIRHAIHLRFYNIYILYRIFGNTLVD